MGIPSQPTQKSLCPGRYPVTSGHKRAAYLMATSQHSLLINYWLLLFLQKVNSQAYSPGQAGAPKLKRVFDVYGQSFRGQLMLHYISPNSEIVSSQRLKKKVSPCSCSGPYSCWAPLPLWYDCPQSSLWSGPVFPAYLGNLPLHLPSS